MQETTMANVANKLKSADNILILAHARPDGDTLGSSYALCAALQNAGKKSRVLCNDKPAAKFDYFIKNAVQEEFTPELVISVDIADKKLLGKDVESAWGDKVDLSVDHHANNRLFAKESWVDASCAATVEMIYQLLVHLSYDITPYIADCLFTGLTTDTGCFRYANVTPKTHEIAAQLMKAGANAGEINKIHFETKTKAFMLLEQIALDSLAFHFDGKCALVSIMQKDFEKTGSSEDDIDAIVAMPRQIEGVFVGATMREKKEGVFKISTRTHDPVDAAAISGRLGGGGHKRAAGCEVYGTFEEAKAAYLAAVKAELEASGI